MPRLRGHHLICLSFFKGEGYGPEFVNKLKKVMQGLEAGEEIEVYPGPDELCVSCHHLSKGICRYSKDAEAEIRGMDNEATRLLGLQAYQTVNWLHIKNKIPAILGQWVKKYCHECEWRWACEIQLSGILQ